jgi:uncharacterized protein (DUF302 family)
MKFISGDPSVSSQALQTAGFASDGKADREPPRGSSQGHTRRTMPEGMVTIASSRSVADTVTRLEALLKEHGVTVFARIDFSADAARAGLAMRPEQLLIFGNPKAGTPLLVQKPSIGLDLPLKALVWEDGEARVFIGYNDPRYLVERHGVETALEKNLSAVVPLIELAAKP